MNYINNEIIKYRNYNYDDRVNPIVPLVNFLSENGFKTIIGHADKAPLHLTLTEPSVRITFLYDGTITMGGIDNDSIIDKGEYYEFSYMYYNQRRYQLDVYQYMENNNDYPAGLEQPIMDIKALLMSPYSKQFLNNQGCSICNIDENVTCMSEMHSNKYLHRGLLYFSILTEERLRLTDKKVKCVDTSFEIFKKK